MIKEEYDKLISLTLSLRIAEGALAEAKEQLKKANEVLRELILKKEDKDALV